MRTRCLPLRLLAASALCLPAFAPRALAQELEIIDDFDGLVVEPAAEAAEPTESAGGVILSEDAATRRRLAQAVRVMENGRPEDAATALGRLAETVGESDLFVQSEEGSLRSAKAELQRLIGGAPPEVKAAYEIGFGLAAARMLAESSSDPALVRRVATLYPHTKAGAAALDRLATTYADEGAFAEAAACLDRLAAIHPQAVAGRYATHALRLSLYRMRSGDRAGAVEAMNGLVRRDPTAILRFAGGDRQRSADDASPDTLLAEVAGARSLDVVPFTPHPGDADAAPPAAFEPFPVPRWTVAVSQEERRTAPSAPAGFPTVVGRLVLTPVRDGFVAHDLATGAPLWSYKSARATGSFDSHTTLAAGHLSTDGRAVFLVEAAGGTRSVFPVPATEPFVQQQAGFFPVQGMFFGPNADAPAASGFGPAHNVLTSLDVTPPRQANRLWRVGGVDGLDEPRLAGHCFLGPPLAAHGRLYAIAEWDRSVRLVTLEAATGRLDWSLELGRVDVPLAADPQRRRIGATPTLARNFLLCPSGGGAVIAVDLVGRSLAWGFRYPQTVSPATAEWRGASVSLPDVTGWIDPTVRVAAGRAFITPPEAGEAYALDLRTGELLWRRPRADGWFIAAANGDRALIVGRDGAHLLHAKDGSAVGPVLPFPDGVVPTGRGYASGEAYVQPLWDGSFFRIDLKTGSAAPSSRSNQGVVAGNLIRHQDTLLSLGSGILRIFESRAVLEAEIAKSLDARPDDVTALLRRADIHSDAGRHAEAIVDARRAFEIEPSQIARNKLIAALLDGVRLGLPNAPAYDSELERLSRLP